MSGWTNDENEALVGAYFEMLVEELEGRSYNKAEYNRRVQQMTGRSRPSIEFRNCNISAVLEALGHPFVLGYKPRRNAQKSLWAPIQLRVSALGSALPLKTTSAADRGVAKMVEETGENDDFWQICGRLWGRATGGADVAARPDRSVDKFWPTAMRPPGVQEALNWLGSPQPAGSLPRWLFLVGGPGAGKSHATAAASKGMRLVSTPESGLASRTYEYTGLHSDLLVINDATISPESAQTPLIDDLNQQAEKAERASGVLTNVLACVNRGILIEELAGHEPASGAGCAGKEVLVWLSQTDHNASDSGWTIDNHEGGIIARSAVLTNDEVPIAHLLVVSVDECSLFEKRPTIDIEGGRVVASADYDITPLESRQDIPEESMPAADLLRVVLESFEDTAPIDQFGADPVTANFENLNTPRGRSSLYTLARSGELACSSRMTYREVWGLIVRAVVGNVPQLMGPDALRDHIHSLQPDGLDADEDFKRIRKLANLRIHQAIFGGIDERATPEEAASDPVLRITSAIDPLRDAIPGEGPFDAQQGWTTPVAEALTSHFSDESPLSIVMRYDPYGHLASVVSRFDWLVDTGFVTLLSDPTLTDQKRHQAVAWYGAYLTRLYAFAFGISAFRTEISLLIKAYRQEGFLPDRLQIPMHTLIRPKRTIDSAVSESLIPLYDSRTDPIIGRQATPKLAIRVGDLELRTEKGGGEQTMLTIFRESKLMAKMTLDFALIREALTCAGDSAGVTDLVEVTAPRLERIRAARLLVRHLEGAEVRIVDGDDGYQVSVPRKVRHN